MQFSKNWLSEFIDISLSTEEICSQLTMAGLEVDGYEHIKSKITGNDSIINLDITPNRGDGFSVLGVARELSVINNVKLRLPILDSVPDSFKDDIGVKVCSEGPIYFGRTLRGISLRSKTLPLIAERLKLSDQKLIDPVVDITNYILLELGQPLHAFDRDKLNGNISVRPAQKKESITLLDDQNITLDSDCLVISDDKEAIAFAGIMGGKNSSVTKTTSSIFLESAFFKPTSVRGRARRYGFQTDASLRFERGVDYKLQEFALGRASSLLQKTVGGSFGNIIGTTKKNSIPKQSKVGISLKRSNKVLGTNISKQKAVRYFKGLGFSPESKDDAITVIAPSWRYDINIEADLIEELARLEGYDSLPQTSLNPVYKKKTKTTEEILNDALTSKGFNEIISYSFISPEDHSLFGEENKTLEVKNPISQNMSIMRTSLVSGLVNSCIYNLNHGQNDQRLFEIGNTFISKKNLVQETKTLAGLIKGNVSAENWSEKSRESSFYDLKGIVLDLLSKFDIEYSFKDNCNNFLHPGMSSSIYFKNQEVGFLGALHPGHLEKLGFKEDVFIFSIEISNFINKAVTSFIEFSKQPLTSRDLAILINKEITSEDLQQVIQSSAGKFFKDIKIFDVYQGKGIAEDKKSIALTISWQSMKNTLLDSEIDQAVEKIVNSVKTKLGGELRI